MNYFDQLADESNISSKYENQLNALNGQKNQIAESVANLKSNYQDQLYNYGLGKYEDITKVIQSSVDLGGLAAIKGAARLYDGSALESTIKEGVATAKDSLKAWYESTASDVLPDFLKPQMSVADTSIELENLPAGAIGRTYTAPTATLEEETGGVIFDNPAFTGEIGGSVAMAAPSETLAAETAVGGVTLGEEQAVASSNIEATAANAGIESSIDAGALSANLASVAPAEISATIADASTLAQETATSSLAELTAGASTLAKGAADTLTSTASGLAENLGITEAAENSLDWTGIGEVLAIGTLAETGIKAFVDWIDPMSKPPPPIAPQFQSLIQAPTYITAQVQAGL